MATCGAPASPTKQPASGIISGNVGEQRHRENVAPPPHRNHHTVVATLSFDTLRVSRRLVDAGFSAAQAEAVTDIVSEASDPASRALVTKQDLRIELAPLGADFGLPKRMVGVSWALSVAILVKLFLG